MMEERGVATKGVKKRGAGRMATRHLLITLATMYENHQVQICHLVGDIWRPLPLMGGGHWGGLLGVGH